MQNMNLDDLFNDAFGEGSQEVKDAKENTIKEEKNSQPKQTKEPETVEFVDKETGVVEKAEVNQKMFKETQKMAKEQAPVVKKSASMIMNERMLARIDELTKSTGEVFTGKNRVIATDIIVSTYQQIRNSGYNIQDVDFLGNNYESQVKRWAKLGVGTQDNLYTELRKNKNTGQIDIKVKPQYQTLEKLIIKYCSKEIFRFKTDVICEGDVFETDFDFATGQDYVKKHEKNPNVDRNELTNITGAYKIAYVKEKNGSVTQLLVQIDKNRIMRAYNSAQTKNVWNNDTQKMVLKTVTWEMWNSEVIRPFMVFPEDIIANDNLSIVNENADVDFDNKDFKHKDIIEAQVNAKESIGTGEGLDF